MSDADYDNDDQGVQTEAAGSVHIDAGHADVTAPAAGGGATLAPSDAVVNMARDVGVLQQTAAQTADKLAKGVEEWQAYKTATENRIAELENRLAGLQSTAESAIATAQNAVQAAEILADQGEVVDSLDSDDNGSGEDELTVTTELPPGPVSGTTPDSPKRPGLKRWRLF